jgi:dynein heavy chain
VWDYIQAIRDKVHDLEMRVQKTKDNIEEIKQIMTTWSKVPLFERKEDKGTCYLSLADQEDKRKKRYNEVTAAGEKIHALVQVKGSHWPSVPTVHFLWLPFQSTDGLTWKLS